MVNLLFAPDRDLLVKKGIVRTLSIRPAARAACSAVADEYLRELNPDAKLEVFGQDYNHESYAVCGSDMLIKGQNIDNIVFGDSFTKDGLPARSSTTCSPIRPSASSGSREQDTIEKEHETQGFDGRFGAGLPRINDGSLLFLST